MRYVESIKRLELTRRNLQTLLEKLDDPLSQRTLIDGDHQIAVVAVEDVTVVAVEDDAHYHNRPPGEVYMPSTGEIK